MIARVEWDSQHFGFPIARIQPGDLDVPDLEAALAEARTAGFRLAHLSRPIDQPIDDATLARMTGRALSANVLFAKPLATGRRPRPEDVSMETVRFVDDGLRDLAIRCGRYSRFRLDPGFPEGAYERLYTTWIERSVKGEIADRVFAARGEDGELLGLVTVVRPSDTVGRIGLIGVSERASGQGVGAALVATAEEAMEQGGARTTEVSTHVENEEARRLFEAFGYEAGPAERAHHFWLEPGS